MLAEYGAAHWELTMFEKLGDGKDKRNSQHTKAFTLGPSSKDVEKQGKEVKDKIAEGENREASGQLGGWMGWDGFVKDDIELGLSFGYRSWVRVRSYTSAHRC